MNLNAKRTDAQKLHVSVLRVRVLKNIPAIISFIDLQFKVFVGTIRKNNRITSRIKRAVIKLLLLIPPTHVPYIRAVFMELQIVFTICLGYIIYKFIKREIILVEKVALKFTRLPAAVVGPAFLLNEAGGLSLLIVCALSVLL